MKARPTRGPAALSNQARKNRMAVALRTTHSHIARNPPRHPSLTLVVSAAQPVPPASSTAPHWGLLAYEGDTQPYDADALLFADKR